MLCTQILIPNQTVTKTLSFLLVSPWPTVCAWKVINTYLKSAIPQYDAVPGASIAVQAYGDFLNFNPHLHAIVSDGCFLDNSSFSVAPKFMVTDLSRIFQHKVLKMHKKAGKINDAIIENMLS